MMMKILLFPFIFALLVASLPPPYMAMLVHLMQGWPSERVHETCSIIRRLYRSYCEALSKSDKQQIAKEYQSIGMVVFDIENRAGLRVQCDKLLVSDLIMSGLRSDAEESAACSAAFTLRLHSHKMDGTDHELCGFDAVKNALILEKNLLSVFHNPVITRSLSRCRLLKVQAMEGVVRYLAQHVYKHDSQRCFELSQLWTEFMIVVHEKVDLLVQSMLRMEFRGSEPLLMSPYWTPASRGSMRSYFWSLSDINYIHMHDADKAIGLIKKKTIISHEKLVDLSSVYCSSFPLNEYAKRFNHEPLLCAAMMSFEMMRRPDSLTVGYMERFSVYHSWTCLNYQLRAAMISFFFQFDLAEMMKERLSGGQSFRQFYHEMITCDGEHIDHLRAIKLHLQTISTGGRVSLCERMSLYQMISSTHHHERVVKQLNGENMLYVYKTKQPNQSVLSSYLSRCIDELEMVKCRFGIGHPLFMTMMRSIAHEYIMADTWNPLSDQEKDEISSSLLQVINTVVTR